jgi:hypothetical protein
VDLVPSAYIGPHASGAGRCRHCQVGTCMLGAQDHGSSKRRYPGVVPEAAQTFHAPSAAFLALLQAARVLVDADNKICDLER